MVIVSSSFTKPHRGRLDIATATDSCRRRVAGSAVTSGHVFLTTECIRTGINDMRFPLRKAVGWPLIVLLGVGGTVALFASDRWLPRVQQLVCQTFDHEFVAAQPDHDHDHEAGDRNLDHEEPSVVRRKETHFEGEHAHDDASLGPAEHAEPMAATRRDDSHEKQAPRREQAGHEHRETFEADACSSHDEIAMHLSAAARDNVGLKLAKVKLSTFERTISIPAMVVERRGKSHLNVAAPFTGRVTRIWPNQGETVTPGQPLFELRLTHEDLVEAQSDFLKTAEELDVVRREVARLQQATATGAIAGKTLLERKYEQDKLEGVLRSQRQRLLLHGLTSAQIEEILASHTLVSNITIFAPASSEQPSGEEPERLLQVESLNVQIGQHVTEGQTLCSLSDYAELYIEGKAFEDDAAALIHAADNNWPTTAMVASGKEKPIQVGDLKILYLANQIDPETRAFLFYVQLPNRLVRDRKEGEHRFSDWQFRPGQRVQLLVPVEQWANRIVLPVDAVVEDGAESYVFEEHDGHFDRRTVRVVYRDQHSAVLANDGALQPGATVAVAGAYQLYLAMKNKAGGAVDPHAGHRH